jgi:uncharacterized membrane protein
MQRTVITYVLWFLQLASLLTILYCASLMLDRPGFALVCAVIILAASLYIEHSTIGEEP